MDQKRYSKQNLDSNDHKGMEIGAQIVKGVIGTVGAVALALLSKNNISKIVNIAVKAIKK